MLSAVPFDAKKSSRYATRLPVRWLALDCAEKARYFAVLIDGGTFK